MTLPIISKSLATYRVLISACSIRSHALDGHTSGNPAANTRARARARFQWVGIANHVEFSSESRWLAHEARSSVQNPRESRREREGNAAPRMRVRFNPNSTLDSAIHPLIDTFHLAIPCRGTAGRSAPTQRQRRCIVSSDNGARYQRFASSCQGCTRRVLGTHLFVVPDVLELPSRTTIRSLKR